MKILYFAPIEWWGIKQRPQHLAERISERCDFYYVQPLGLRQLKVTDLKRVIKRLKGLLQRKTNTNDKLKIIEPIFLPFMGRLWQKINLQLLRLQLGKIATIETVIWVTSPAPLTFELVQKLKHKQLIYEMLDDYSKIHPSKAQAIEARERWLIKNAALTLVTSAALLAKAKKIDPAVNVKLVTNGVAFDLFASANKNVPAELQGMQNIVGYIGAIDSWMDCGAVEYLAKAKPDLNFVFVGPVRIDWQPKAKNILFVGEKFYELVPAYIAAFKVCLIPFTVSAFADTINPVKLYEYFALGKPVVSFTMQELLPFAAILYLAAEQTEFLQQLESALIENSSDLINKRLEVAKNNDWLAKANEIYALISSLDVK